MLVLEMVQSGSSASSVGTTATVPAALIAPSNEIANATTEQKCDMVLANNQSLNDLNDDFTQLVQSGTVVVYFNLFIWNDTTSLNQSFDVASGKDTFAPNVWVWASGKGKDLLRMPIDYSILSLGLLTLNTAQMDIVFNQTLVDCLLSRSTNHAADAIARFITEDIASNETVAIPNNVGPVVCRSAFAFRHRIFGLRGVGFRCCRQVVNSQWYKCTMKYTSGWELVWYGPMAMLGWVYALAAARAYKLCRPFFRQSELPSLKRSDGVDEIMQGIKNEIVAKISGLTKPMMFLSKPDELTSLGEAARPFDVFGIEKGIQVKIISALRLAAVVAVFFVYYAFVAVVLFEYSQLLAVTGQQLADTQQVFLNVFGHIGWICCRRDLAIFGYALFELIYTLAMPIFVFLAYVIFTFRTNVSEEKQEQIDCDVVIAADDQGLTTKQHTVINKMKHSATRFINSSCGKRVQIVSSVVVLVYVIFLAGPYVTYIVYFTGLGIVGNIDVFSPWIIPLTIGLTFLGTTFNVPAGHYRLIKEMFFDVCLRDYSKVIVVEKDGNAFLPRDLIDAFYVPRSHAIIEACFRRIVRSLTFIMLGALVIMTVQFPYNFQLDSIASFLSVQVVFVLPMLAQSMQGISLSAVETYVLQKDVRAYIDDYIKRNNLTDESAVTRCSVGNDGKSGEADLAVDNAVTADCDRSYRQGHRREDNKETDEEHRKRKKKRMKHRLALSPVA